MKYIVVIGDGMADRPLEQLSGKTPLQAAKKPNMDRIAREGRCGMLKTLYDGLPFGSDIANLSVLGYDPRKYYTGGRGPLEAASQGILLGEGDIALRCNIITAEDGEVRDHSGGHISSEEARMLIESLKKELEAPGIEFFPGVGYRNLLVLRGSEYSTEIECDPPHDIIKERVADHMVQAKNPEGKKTAELLNDLMIRSKSLLDSHPVNLARQKAGKSKANMLWFWGAGRRLALPRFEERFGLKGALISAVDLLKGLAVYLGLSVIEVPGATGYLDTNYEGKADKAVEALKDHDLVYVHVEATDEAGHQGDLEAKIKAIEDLDLRLIGRMFDSLDGDYKIAVLPDHATPIDVRTHTPEPIPFAIYSTKDRGDSVGFYDEESAQKGSYGIIEGPGFMKLLLDK